MADSAGQAEPSFWPSVGEYPVYDRLLYLILSGDETRNELYRSAIRAVVPGKTVVDIGTGATLLWARTAIEAGARHAYAIEAQSDAFERAQAYIAEHGLADKITLVRGISSEVELPERVEVCISEIIGSIGSSEGSVPVLRDARKRFLTARGTMIPARCETRIAMAELPDPLHRKPRFHRVASRYVESIFERNGVPFDVRVMLYKVGAEMLLSHSASFEELDFESSAIWSGSENSSSSRRFELIASRDGRIDGLTAWIRLQCMNEAPVLDSLEHKTNWLPVFFPVFYPGLELHEGDRLEAEMSMTPGRDGLHPDYRIRGTLKRYLSRHAVPECVEFDYHSPHYGSAFRANPLYRALLEGWTSEGVQREVPASSP